MYHKRCIKSPPHGDLHPEAETGTLVGKPEKRRFNAASDITYIRTDVEPSQPHGFFIVRKLDSAPSCLSRNDLERVDLRGLDYSGNGKLRCNLLLLHSLISSAYGRLSSLLFGPKLRSVADQTYRCAAGCERSILRMAAMSFLRRPN